MKKLRLAVCLWLLTQPGCHWIYAFDDVIPTGSPAAPEKLPAWEANARVVLAGAKRWALKRWGRS